jgi:hypothetical protein
MFAEPKLYPVIPLAGLDPAIHVSFHGCSYMKTWTPGSSPGEARRG